MATNQIRLLDASRPQDTEVGVYADFPYKAVRCTLKASGYFHDFGRFLAALENSFPHMRVEGLVLDSAQGAKDENLEKLTLQFDLITLVKPADKNI